MKTYLQGKLLHRLLLTMFVALIAVSATYAQTPGVIYQQASSSGRLVLDPNGDGYISTTTTGFPGTNDVGAASEIPYRTLPGLVPEPIGDVRNSVSGGHTDLAPPSPVQVYFDGQNVLFRFRLGGTSSAIRGYSVLIDTDNTATGTGANPGFEYEVLLSSNSDVKVIGHSGTTSQTLFTGADTQYSQRAVAASTGGGDADYFYDFYVPLSAFGDGLTSTTALRMVGSTVNVGQSALADPTTVADVAGVNYQSYNGDAPEAWRALLGIFPPTTLTQIQSTGFTPLASTAPFVSSPITTLSTSISGTSIEAAGSVVTVLRNGTAICGGAGQPACPTVSADGTWILANIPAGTLAVGNTITARVTAPGETISPVSNTVTVTEGICTATPAPRLTGTTPIPGGPQESLIFIPSFSGNQIITVYNITTGASSSTPVLNLTAGTAYSSPNATTAPALIISNNSTDSYQITATPTTAAGTATGCTSPRSNVLCAEQGTSSTTNPNVITITGVTYDAVTNTSTTSPTWTQVPTNLTSITLNIDFGGVTSGTLVLYRNGIATNVTAAITGNATTRTLNVSGVSPALNAGDILTVRSVVTSSSCTAVSGPSANPLTVLATTAAPTINQPPCGLVTTLSGTSTEAPGTVIQFYTGGTAGTRTGTLVTQSGTTTPITATVTSTGVWVAELTSAEGGGIPAGTPITARAQAPGKFRSVNSNAVTSDPATPGVLTITGPITEGSTSVSGTAPASANGSLVTLYIDGTPFYSSVAVANGAWTVSGISSLELFAGASVSATFTPSGGCESARATPVIVTCNTPVATYTLTPTTVTVCGGNTTSFELSGSEYGVLYRLLVDGNESGSSVVGTGGPITLTSGDFTNLTSLNTTQTVTYRARRVSGVNCDAISTSSAIVTVRPQPATTGLTLTPITPQPVCGNRSVSYTLSGSSPSYIYQLVDQSTGEVVGDPVAGSTGNITLTTGPITSNTTLGLQVSFPGEDACSVIVPDQATVFITGPSIDNFVFAENEKVCIGNGTTITVQTQLNANYTYQIFRRMGSQINTVTDQRVGSSFPGTGGLVSRTTPLLTQEREEFFYVTVTGSPCGQILLTNTATVLVTNAALQADAGEDQRVCADFVVLNANDVGQDAGAWSQVSGPTQAVFTPASANNATASNLAPGTYVFRWTSTPVCGTGGTPSTDDVTIIVNCDPFYTINPPRYNNEYSVGDILAFATDPDGDIIGAEIIFGSLPAGLSLAADGTIAVTNISLLGEGAFPLTIELTDEFNQTVALSIVIRLLGNTPIIVPLPVELVYFTATVRNNQAHLEWLTASEQDNDRFEIERSLDAKSFEKIGTVKGKGTTSLETKYQFTDRTPVQSTVYYRLKQVDFDGEFAYSKVIAVTARGLANELATQVYPNPFQDRVKVMLTSPNAQQAQMVLYDLNGKRVMSKTLDLDAGVNEMELQLQQLGTGMYILKISGDGMDSTTKIIKN
jgi:hypothetical protein